MQVALRRQQAQEENEARELGLLYTNSVRTPNANENGNQNMAFHAGIPSPPNDSDSGQRGSYAGSEPDVDTQKMRSDRVGDMASAYSPDQSEPDSPGKSRKKRKTNQEERDWKIAVAPLRRVSNFIRQLCFICSLGYVGTYVGTTSFSILHDVFTQREKC
jgi:hypothetical protein